MDKRAKRITEASAFRAGSVPPMLPAPKELIMKIKVEYEESGTTYEMVRLEDGKLINCGGRYLPF